MLDHVTTPTSKLMPPTLQTMAPGAYDMREKVTNPLVDRRCSRGARRLTSMTRTKALRSLRARLTDRYGENKARETGITLTARFRCQDQARDFADLVKVAGGEVWECRKVGRMGRATGALTWRVEFTVGTAADQYLAGRVDLRTMQGWPA